MHTLRIFDSLWREPEDAIRQSESAPRDVPKGHTLLVKLVGRPLGSPLGKGLVLDWDRHRFLVCQLAEPSRTGRHEGAQPAASFGSSQLPQRFGFDLRIVRG